jgi:hypothetical protein
MYTVFLIDDLGLALHRFGGLPMRHCLKLADNHRSGFGFCRSQNDFQHHLTGFARSNFKKSRHEFKVCDGEICFCPDELYFHQAKIKVRRDENEVRQDTGGFPADGNGYHQATFLVSEVKS